MQLVSVPECECVQPITVEQLRYLGLRQLAYLKTEILDGEMIFVIYGANGIPFEVVDAFETAVETAAACQLSIVSLH
jgi:hypothetical protein